MPKKITPLLQAVGDRNFEEFERILEGGVSQEDLNDAFVYASSHLFFEEHVKMLNILIEHGADIHYNRDGALRHAAVRAGQFRNLDTRMVDHLIDIGLEPHVALSFIDNSTKYYLKNYDPKGWEYLKELNRKTKVISVPLTDDPSCGICLEKFEKKDNAVA